MVLLGLNGRAGSGKDSAFLEIQRWAEERGVTAVRRGFADKLKLSAARIFKPDATLEEALEWCDKMKFDGLLRAVRTRPARDEDFIEFDGTACGVPHGVTMIEDSYLEISGRMFLQRYGTEAHRDVFGSDFWIDALLPFWNAEGDRHWRDSFPGTDIAVITDVRFINEAERIKDLGGYIWKIDRPLDTIDRHASELELPPGVADLVIDNSGTLDEFLGNVSNAMSDHFHFPIERATP